VAQQIRDDVFGLDGPQFMGCYDAGKRRTATSADTFSQRLDGSDIHFYRRVTPWEYQSAGHMRLVYAVATVVDWLTTLTVITDDWADGGEVHNGRPCGGRHRRRPHRR
jgi:hypothetical protein